MIERRHLDRLIVLIAMMCGATPLSWRALSFCDVTFKRQNVAIQRRGW